ncbi:hypothetical protein IH979_00745, partial [Patescibacteria group bacterium]|nr:hypothetical protein [Patescibacteria group bacterium]
IILSTTINSDNLTLTSSIFETGESPAHEMHYYFSSDELEDESTGTLYTQTEVKHGVFLESIEDTTYEYRMGIGEGIKNEYQNCYDPAEGPGREGGTCGTSESQPWCCNGTPSSSTCPTF